MRIVGGAARGRRLQAPRGQDTRPTADRVRQSLFDYLGQRCDDLRVLDLYAGTGALALEALSRGAAQATFVERDKQAARTIETNIGALGFVDRCTLLVEDVARALARLAAAGSSFDLIFSDPPYALQASQSTLDALHAAGLLRPGGRVVLERDRREPAPGLPPGLVLLDDRAHGDTRLFVAERSFG